jgi:hypothetical protein
MQVENKFVRWCKRLRRNGILAGLILGAAMLFAGAGGPSTAMAQDAEYACRQDAFRLCSQYIPNEGAVKVCMRRNVRRLSASCRVAFVGGKRAGRHHARTHRHHHRHHRKHHRRHR